MNFGLPDQFHLRGILTKVGTGGERTRGAAAGAGLDTAGRLVQRRANIRSSKRGARDHTETTARSSARNG